MKKNLLWLVPQVVAGFVLCGMPIAFAQFTTQASLVRNTFSTSASFITPTPTPKDEDGPDCDADDPCTSLTPTPKPCTDCDHDCDYPNSDDICSQHGHHIHFIFYHDHGKYFFKFAIDHMKDWKHIHYDFQYDHNKITEDIQGKEDNDKDAYTSEPIQLGTCSANACINHDDAHNFSLHVRAGKYDDNSPDDLQMNDKQ